MRTWALDRLDQLVCKPVDGSGGYGLVIGPHASDEELADAAPSGRSPNPRGWIAQEPVALSTVADATSTDAMGAAPPRPAAVRGERRARRVGGARAASTRVALPEGSLVVNSSQGGGSKDTWVLAPVRSGTRAIAGHRAARAAPPMHVVREPRTRPDARGRPAAAAATTAAAAVGPKIRAEPHRRVAVLDRPLHRAGRGHRAPPRRALPPAARGPPRRRGGGVCVRCSTRWAPTTSRRSVADIDARHRVARARPRRTRARSSARSQRRGRTRAARARRISSEMWESAQHDAPRGSPATSAAGAVAARTTSSAG